MHAKSLYILGFMCMAVYRDTTKMHPRYGIGMAEWLSKCPRSIATVYSIYGMEGVDFCTLSWT